ncbi:MAG: hypothetical protein FWE57_00010 [Chitinispirillia bacterium]|nr:hypothetical protein [Chitinispirillia bacterium]
MEKEKKTIFFVCPIGDEGTETRRNSDIVFKVIERVIKNIKEFSEYDIVRADKIEESGRITTHICQQLKTSDICIVDLTDLNPNVLYEFGIRQALLKPYVLIAKKETILPFDLKDSRTVFYDMSDIESVLKLDDRLKGHLLTALEGKIDEYDKKLFGDRENSLVTSEGGFDLRLMETLNDVINAERKTSDNVEDLLNQFKTLSNKYSLSSNKIETLFQSTSKGAGTYLFINGENQAFSALTAALARAKKVIRTTRFSPFAVGSRQPEFAKMIQNRIKGENGYDPVTHFYRIMTANAKTKRNDIEQYLKTFVGRRFTLYLTSRTNNFELVIIDESEVFIHFHGHGEDMVIGSTLHIVNDEVAKKFITIYSSLHDLKFDQNIKKYDFKYISGPEIPEIRQEIEEYFEKHCDADNDASVPEMV